MYVCMFLYVVNLLGYIFVALRIQLWALGERRSNEGEVSEICSGLIWSVVTSMYMEHWEVDHIMLNARLRLLEIMYVPD